MREPAHVYFMGGPNDLTKQVIEITPNQWAITINEVLPLTIKSGYSAGLLTQMNAEIRQHRYELLKLHPPIKVGDLPLYAAVWQESRP